MRKAEAGNGPSRCAVRFDAVSKQFGDFHALSEVSLRVDEGECVVVCGPSGSGKSTLIRCINRLECHDTGTVHIENLEITERSADEARRLTGMLFQHFNLFPHLTVLNNCTLAPRLVLGNSLAEAEATAMKYLERVRIADQAGKFPGQLSGGQQQRAAIARCLSMEPRVLLLDEPTSALDPEMITEVLDVLIGLARDGRTMICVTHEMQFAREVADRVVFMDRGTIVETASPEAFFTDARTARARKFLGQLQNV